MVQRSIIRLVSVEPPAVVRAKPVPAVQIREAPKDVHGAFAEALGVALLTADATLARAPGTRCSFLLVRASSGQPFTEHRLSTGILG